MYLRQKTLSVAFSTRRWFFVVLAFITLFFLFWYPHSHTGYLKAISIDHMNFVSTVGLNMAWVPNKKQGTEVDLPHIWNKTPNKTVDAMYYANFSLAHNPAELWAVYLPALSMNGSVAINGEQVGAGGELKKSVTRQWNYPQYYFIPRELLKTGPNQIEIHIVADPPGHGLLAPFYVGTDSALHRTYNHDRFFRVTLSFVIIGFSLTVSGLMFALWLLRRKETIYGWFALTILWWCIHSLNLVVTRPPISRIFWDWLWFSSVGVFVVLIVVFIHRFLKYSRPRVEFVLAIVGLCGVTLLAILAGFREDLFYDFAHHMWDTAAVTLGIYPAVMMINANRRVENFESQLLLVSGLLILAFGFHDWMVLNSIIDCTHGLLLQFSAPIVIIAFAWILLKRFVQALDDSEQLNQELEARVEQKMLELSRQYEKTQKLKEANMIAQERERIMFDMHDGVGGQLVSLLSLAESGKAIPNQISEGIRETLDVLRMAINSLDAGSGDMANTLRMLREQMLPRLSARGIDVFWPVQNTPEFSYLTTVQAQQIARILMEALTNVIKHANATRISVTIMSKGLTSGDIALVFEVVDNGCGLNSDKPGRGLTSMARRADKLDAELSINSKPGETRVTLEVPVNTK